MKAKLFLSLVGSLALALAVPRLAMATALQQASAVGARDAQGNVTWTTNLQCPFAVQTPVPPAGPVCSDAQGSYSACTGNGTCAPTAGACCAVVILLADADGGTVGYPRPGHKGDCVSCNLTGVCDFEIVPKTGAGRVEAHRTCAE